MKVFYLLTDLHSEDIMNIVIGQGGNEPISIVSILNEKPKFLFISNGKFTMWNYYVLRMFKIPYVVVKDLPANNNSLARKFYLNSVGELTYPTKPSEIEQLVRAMIVSTARKKMARKKKSGK